MTVLFLDLNLKLAVTLQEFYGHNNKVQKSGKVDFSTAHIFLRGI